MSSGGQLGFTLLEIMLAMLILGMVVAMVSVSLSGSVRVMEGAMDQGDVYYRAQVALERISEDISSAVLTDDTNFVSGKEGGLEQSRLLTFVSLAHLSFDPEKGLPGLGLISYALQPDKSNSRQLLLLRADSLNMPVSEEQKNGGETEAFLLADRLRSVKFTFFNRNGEEQDSWDTAVKESEETERSLPAAVACRLEFWLDEEQDASISFQTTALLPTGLIRPQPKED
ncbi:PulJ/GspJ family protein [Candidatus Electronema sp. TJ]|uniref:PulJ/GspJ family protein n=1 Tax=Candidatus Electronema sp. TJ TaxID=3401573 RepID=UPI003AA8A689